MEVEISGGIFCLHEVAPLFESLPAYKEMNKKHRICDRIAKYGAFLTIRGV